MAAWWKNLPLLVGTVFMVGNFIPANQQAKAQSDPWSLAASSSLIAQAAEPEALEHNVLTFQEVQRLNLDLENTISQCRNFQERRNYNDCLLLLDKYVATLPTFEHEELTRLNTQVTQRRNLVVELALIPALEEGKHLEYYSAIFKAYMNFPEHNFPFDEVLPIWQTYKLEPSANSRFKKYQTVRVLARNTSDGDEAVLDLFNQYIQDRFHEYGFKLVDLTTTAPPSGARRETLVKISLTGEELKNVADATLGQTLYQLKSDITSIRYTDPTGQRLPPRTWTTLENSTSTEEARRDVVQKVAPQVADAVFFLTLKQMFGTK